MATGLGFCSTCGTPRTAAEQKFCATCGGAFAAIVAPTAMPAPPAPPVEAAPPPPPAWAVQAPLAPPPPPPVDYAPPPPPAWGSQVPQSYQPAPQSYPTTAPVGQTRSNSRVSPALLLVGLLLIAAVAGGAYLFTNNGKGPGTSGAPASGAISSSKTSQPGTSGRPNVTTQPGTSAQTGDSGLAGAATNLSSITSYRFSMTLAGGEFGSMLSALGGAGASGDTPFTMNGTVVTTPDKAADINMAGFHMIEIGGFDYLDMSGSGQFYKTPVSGSSLADSFSPATMFSDAMDTSSSSGFNKVGSDTKNGVAADHYQASQSELAGFASSQGIADATWSADIWIAQQGGYPVSMTIMAVASDKSVAYEIKFDLSNVNDPSNKVTAPANAIGL